MTHSLLNFGARALLPLLVLSFACGDDDGPDGPVDSAVMDVSALDTAIADDSGEGMDVGEEVDAGETDAGTDAMAPVDAGDAAPADMDADVPFVQMCTGTASCADVVQEQCSMTAGCSESRVTGRCARRVGLKFPAPTECATVGDAVDCERNSSCQWIGDCTLDEGVTCESRPITTCGALGCALTCATGDDCDDAQSCVDGRCVTL